MPITNLVQSLEDNQAIFRSLLHSVEESAYLWRPNPEHWCLLEIICHLYDEEQEDFRARVQSILENPEQTLSPIDPVAWVKERAYLEQNFHEKLEAFLTERSSNVQWLHSLESPNWDLVYQHPTRGPLSAQFFLSNWVAHDFLHIRQITRIRYQYIQHVTGDSVAYAGNW